MPNQKRIIKALVAILCLGAIQTQDQGLCAQNTKQGCVICYLGRVDPKTSQCDLIRPDNHCNFWSRAKSKDKVFDICLGCQKGYVNTIKNRGPDFACVKDPNYITNCYSEFNTFGRKYCQSCKGGAPSLDQRSCLNWSQLRNPIAGCVIGSTTQGGKIVCDLCKLGLVFNTVSGKCEKPPQGLEGCTAITNGKCAQSYGCNVYDGYGQLPNGKCVKER